MSTRPYANTPTAVTLREMHACGLTWRALSAQLGYDHSTLCNCASGRDRAGPSLVRDVAELQRQMEAA